MESPKGFIGIQRWFAPSNWMILFRSLTTNVILTCSHPSWDGRVYSNTWRSHLWMIITSLRIPMRFILKSVD
jgi:hypothetical protein